MIHLGTRFHSVYLIKKKKGESVLVQMGIVFNFIFCCGCMKKKNIINNKPKPNDFDKLRKNVTSVMFSYLDAKDVARLTQTN